MNKTWIFFKLRLLQLRYDKTALFFSYILPVLLLMGIGYPMEMMNKAEISVEYIDQVNSPASSELIATLEANEKLNLESYEGTVPFDEAIRENEVTHLLVIDQAQEASDSEGSVRIPALNGLTLHLYANDQAEHFIESKALAQIISEMFDAGHPDVKASTVDTGSITSYIVTLLPGLMGMTLLIIGLNGFGGVLIEESHEGLFKNIKTIDASPIPFLSGLLLSRLVVSYSVAAALFVIGIFMFGLNAKVDFLLALVVLTLGCVAFLGIGLVIAVFSPSVNSFNGIVNFVEIPFLVFSGVFFSITAFPEWLQLVAKAIPLTHMNSALQSIIFDGVSVASISSISTELSVLFAWCVATLWLGWKKFAW